MLRSSKVTVELGFEKMVGIDAWQQHYYGTTLSWNNIIMEQHYHGTTLSWNNIIMEQHYHGTTLSWDNSYCTKDSSCILRPGGSHNAEGRKILLLNLAACAQTIGASMMLEFVCGMGPYR